MVWSGSKLFVWGGVDVNDSVTAVDGGAVYDLADDEWTSIPSLNAPSARVLGLATWTGTHVVVWGGKSGYLGDAALARLDGGAYDLETNTWTELGEADGAPMAKSFASVVWFGDSAVARVNSEAPGDDPTYYRFYPFQQ